MTASRHSKINTTLRVIAGMCAVVWLVGPFYCSLLCGAKCICDGPGHKQVCAGQASPDHHDDNVVTHNVVTHEHEQSHGATQAHQHDDGEAQPERGSSGKQGCDDKLCCSTMQALLPTAQPIFIANSISQQVFAVCPLNAAAENAFAASNCETVRQAKPRDWVFTPVVCLDAAHRSLAPPSPAVG